MRTVTGDLWAVEAEWRIIPTNLVVRRDGCAVMGAGVALQAAQRHPDLPALLGSAIRNDYPHASVVHFARYGLTCLATKHHWRDRSRLEWIEEGLRQFRHDDTDFLRIQGPIALPLLGCGLGGLPATTVRPLLERLLDDRFVLVLRRETTAAPDVLNPDAQ